MASMDLDRDTCYRALRARDRRFDGRFFTGVTSTGVYCRPVCPARTPRRENCRFFACAAAAEAAGFRACRRCRPDAAPGTPAWLGAPTTVARALRLIEEGALDRWNGGRDVGREPDGDAEGVEALAARLGIGGRHLRRLFKDHLGASPLAVALTRRAHFGRRLLEQTSLPVGQVALACGFGGARRFHAAMRRAFGLSPSEIRRAVPAGGRVPTDGGLTLRLPARGPLGWDRLLAYLGPRAIPGVESVAGGLYRRTVEIDGAVGILTLGAASGDDALLLRIPTAAAPTLAGLAERARRLADLAVDPAVVADHLRADPALAARLDAGAVCRVPGAWDRFELAVRAILGQQVSVAAATSRAGRLVRAFGRPVADPAPGREPTPGSEPAPGWLFPTAAVLAGQSSGRIAAAVGLPRARAGALRALAAAVAAGEPVLEPAASLGEAVARLVALPGLGPWTANYIALRALGEPDALPDGDLGLRRALAAGAGPLTARQVAARAEAWRPWRGYGAVLLWAAPAPGSTPIPDPITPTGRIR